MKQFFWYRVTEIGTAEMLPDTAEVRAAIDSGALQVYASIEGAIIHGGVQATAFQRRVEMTYDAAAWLRGDGLIEAGERVTLKITAQPRRLR